MKPYKPYKGTPPGTPTRNPRSKKVAVSPAARELTTRALRKSPRKSVRMMAPVIPEVDSDDAESSDSIMSEKTLVAALAKKSWHKHLRNSDKHPLLEQSDSKDDSIVEIKKRKGKDVSLKILDISSEEIQLPPCSPQKEVQNEEQEVEKPETPIKARPRRKARQDDDGEMIQAELNKSMGNLESPQEDREPSKSSLLAFKKSGTVRHSESEESEPEIRKRPVFRKSTLIAQNDTNYSGLFKDMTIDSSNNAEDTASDPDSPIVAKRKKPKKSVKKSEPSVLLDLKFDQTTVVQDSIDSSQSDNDEIIKKRVRPKKSIFKPADISLDLAEEEIENNPVVSDIDSDNADLVIRRKRLRASKRSTINQPEINLSNLTPEKVTPAEEEDDESEHEVIKRRRTKRTKTGSDAANPIVNLDIVPTPEKAVIEQEDSEEELPLPKRSRPRTTKKSIVSNFQLPEMTPEKRSVPMDSESEEEIIPKRITRKSNREKLLDDPDANVDYMSPEQKGVPEELSDEEELPPTRKLRSSAKKRDLSDEVPNIHLTPERASIPKGSESEDSPVSILKRTKPNRKTNTNEENMELSLENASINAEHTDKPRRATQPFHKAPTPSSFRGPTPNLPTSPDLSVAPGVNISMKSLAASSRLQDLNMTPLAQPDMEMSLEKSSHKNISRLTRGASEANKAVSVDSDDEKSNSSDTESLPAIKKRPGKDKSNRNVSDFFLSPYADTNKSSVRSAKDMELEVTNSKQSVSSKSVEDDEDNEIPLIRRQKRTKSGNSTNLSFNLSPPSAKESIEASSQRTTKSTSDMDLTTLGNTANVSKSKSNSADDSDEEVDQRKFSKASKKPSKQSQKALPDLRDSPAKNLRSSSTARYQESESDEDPVINQRVKPKKSTFNEDFNLSPLSNPSKSSSPHKQHDQNQLSDKERSLTKMSSADSEPTNRSSVASKSGPSKSIIRSSERSKVAASEQEISLAKDSSTANDQDSDSDEEPLITHRAKPKKSTFNEDFHLSPLSTPSKSGKNDDDASLQRDSRKSSKSKDKLSDIDENEGPSKKSSVKPSKGFDKRSRSSSATGSKSTSNDEEKDSKKDASIKSKSKTLSKPVEENSRSSSTANSDSDEEPLINQRVKPKKSTFVEDFNLSPLSTSSKSSNSKEKKLSDIDENEGPSKKSSVKPSKGFDKRSRSSSATGSKSTSNDEEKDSKKDASIKSKSKTLSKPVEENSRSSSTANSDSDEEPLINQRVKPKKSTFVEDFNLSPLSTSSKSSNSKEKKLSEIDENEGPSKKSSVKPSKGFDKRSRSSSATGSKSTSNDEEKDSRKDASIKSKSKTPSKPAEENSRSSLTANSDSEEEPLINRRAKPKKSTFSEDFHLSPLSTPSKSSKSTEKMLSDNDENEVPSIESSFKPSKGFDKRSRSSSSATVSKSTSNDGERDSRKDASIKKSTTISKPVEENSINSSTANSDSDEEPLINQRVKPKKSTFVEDLNISLPVFTPAKSVRNDDDTDDVAPLQKDAQKNRLTNNMSIATQEVPGDRSSSLMPAGKLQNKSRSKSNESSANLDATKSTSTKDKTSIASNSKSSDEEDLISASRKSKNSSKAAVLSDLEKSRVKNSISLSIAVEDPDSDRDSDIVINKREKPKKSANTTIESFNLTGLTSPAKSVRNADISDDDEVPLQKYRSNMSKKSTNKSQEQSDQTSLSTEQEMDQMKGNSSGKNTGIPRKSKQLKDVEDILNFAKKSASGVKGRDFKVMSLSKSVDYSKVSESINDALVASKDSLPNLQSKRLTQISNVSSENFNLRLETTTENTIDDGAQADLPLRTKSAASFATAPVLDAENVDKQRSKSWAANKNTPTMTELTAVEKVVTVTDAKMSQGSVRSSQTTHVSESPDKESPDIDDAAEFDSAPLEHYENIVQEAEKSGKILEFEIDELTTQHQKSRAKSLATGAKRGIEEDLGQTILSDDEIPLKRKRKVSARFTLDEDIIGDLNFEEESNIASNRSAAEVPTHKQQNNKDESSDNESEASDTDEMHVDFKRRKAQSKKSSVVSMSAISNLKFSFAESNSTRKSTVAETGDANVVAKSPKTSKNSKAKSAKSLLEQVPSAAVDLTAESEGISLTHDMDDNFARFSTFKPGTTEDNILDLLGGNRTSKPSTRKESQMASTENKTADKSKKSDYFKSPPERKLALVKKSKLSVATKRVSFVNKSKVPPAQPTRESIKRNLQVSLEVASPDVIPDADNESSLQTADYLERGRTSTPINDITVTLQEGQSAIMFLENNEHIASDSPEHERIYTASDFQAALDAAGSTLKLPFDKSKKLFTLFELGQAMQAVRSPSMFATSGRLSTGQSKLFSFWDFERALVKLKIEQQKKSTTVAAEVETESQEANILSDESVDQAVGGLSNAESEKGSTQQDELHTAMETTIEHSQVIPSPENELEEEVDETVVDYDSYDLDNSAKEVVDEDEASSEDKTIVESPDEEEIGNMEEHTATADEETQPESSQEQQSQESINQPSSNASKDSGLEKDDSLSPPEDNVGTIEESVDEEENSSAHNQVEKDDSLSPPEDNVGTIEESEDEEENSSAHNQVEKDDSLSPPEDNVGTIEESVVEEEENSSAHNQVGEDASSSQQVITAKSPAKPLSAMRKSLQALDANRPSSGKTLITSYFNRTAGSSSQTRAKRSLLQDSSPHAKRALNISGVNHMKPSKTMQDFLGKWKTYAAEMVAEKQVRDQAAASKLAKKAQKERAELRAQAALAKKPKANTVKRKPLLNVNILTEIKKPWVNKRLVKRVQNHFKGEVPKVMNDFLRNLTLDVEKVCACKKKVPDASVRRVMRLLHKTGVCKTENEFFSFAHDFLPSSFERVAFKDRNFEENYYEFK